MKQNCNVLNVESFYRINGSSYRMFLLLFLFTTVLSAQVSNNGNIYIADLGEMYVATSDFNFGGSPASTATTRTANTNGVLSFGGSATSSGGADTHFLDGYGKTYSNSFFVIPVGQTGVYAPVGIDALNTDGVSTAFYRSDPTVTFGTTLASSLSAISAVEYWHIEGENSNTAKVSLTWRSSSDVLALTSGLTTSLPNLAIAGWNGTQWEEIPSAYDVTSVLGGASSVTTGSITSTSEIDLSTYTHFTFALKESCAPLVASSGVTKTWNGSWSPSAPTLADPVIINAAYSGTLECNSLVLNADITLADTEYLEIVGSATGSGKVVMSSKSNFVQRNSSAAAPNIELTKTTENKRRYDYVYWGTPIAGNFFSQINAAQAQTASVAGVFDYKYKYVAGPPPGNLWQTLTSISTGSGYITRVKQQAPFTNATNQDKIDMKFTGAANNGDVTVAVAYNPSCTNCGSSHNVLANPYPSSIDAIKFLRENTIIDGAIYLWTSNTSVTIGNYSQSDYAVWNLAGTVNTSPNSFTVDGKIDSGQGFVVKALGNGNVTFTNCMRLSGSNTANFFRMSEELPENVNRFKLNLTNSSDVFSQILVAYMPEATLGYDRLYDAGRNSTSTAQLYSIFEGDGRKLAINSRPAFDINDIVPVGISKSTTDLEQFTIAIQEKEGVFSDNTITVYLHDKDLGIYHDLSLSSYNFYTNATALNSRFEIVYQNEFLNNPTFDNNAVYASLSNNKFKVHATTEINQIIIFDLTGRQIAFYDNLNNTEFSTDFFHAEGAYIAKIKQTSGIITTQKLLNVTKQ